MQQKIEETPGDVSGCNVNDVTIVTEARTRTADCIDNPAISENPIGQQTSVAGDRISVY